MILLWIKRAVFIVTWIMTVIVGWEFLMILFTKDWPYRYILSAIGLSILIQSIFFSKGPK